jgi:hypothetical protein
MIRDRYLKAVLAVIAGALVAIAVNAWLTTLEPRRAEAQAKYEVAIPKTWGKVVGFAGGDVLLEDKDGTLRQVETYGKGADFPRIKVQMSRN